MAPGTESQLPPIERIPPELRMKILRLILLSSDIKAPNRVRRYTEVSAIEVEKYKLDPDGENINGRYTFEPAISLQLINKRLFAEAKDVLKEKKFIKVSFKWMSTAIVVEGLKNHDVPFFFLDGKHPFSNPVATLLITSTSFPLESTAVFAIFTEDIPSFCTFLRMVDMGNAIRLQFTFKFFGISSLALQKQVLEPFEVVDGVDGQQKVSVAGTVDSNLVKRVISTMTQPVGWLPALSWNVYDLIVNLKVIGDEAFLARDYGAAGYKYSQATNFIDAVMSKIPFAREIDEDFDSALLHIDAICTGNQILSTLQRRTQSNNGAFSDVVGMYQLESEEHSMNGKERARLAYIHAISDLYAGRWKEAAKTLVWAVKMTPKAREKAIYKGYLITARAYPTSTSRERSQEIETLLKALPSTPFATPKKIPYTYVQAAADKYVMEKLGFTGKIPQGVTDHVMEGVSLCLVSGPGGSLRSAQVGWVFPKVLDEVVKQCKMRAKELDKARPGQLRIKTWVRLNLEQIGSESCMDDPNWRRTMESVMASQPPIFHF